MSASDTPIATGAVQRVATLAMTLVLGLAGWVGFCQAQQLYRWVDDKGEVHYTDQVPASQADKERARLSSEGVVVETVPPAPTEEEIRAAKERERQQAEEERRRVEQQTADERLLRSYRTIEELELAREGKIAAVEALIQVKRDGVRAETQGLLALNDELKALEKASKPVPQELTDKIALAVTRIRDGYAQVVENEYRKQDIRNEFDETIAHYRRLKRLPDPPADDEDSDEAAMLKLSILVRCAGEEQCHNDWRRAVEYVRSNSDKQKEVVAPGLLIGFQRDEREDRSLTLSWTQQAPDRPVHLYLDVQCKNRLTASLVCVNPTIPQIRDGFYAAVVGDEVAR